MFDVSFSELLVIAVVALLVIGPEKLPKVARTVGAFTGRMQRYVAQVKEEVNREVRFEELQKLQQEIKQSVEHESAALQASINKPTSPAETKSELPKVKRRIKTPPKQSIAEKEPAIKKVATPQKVTAPKKITAPKKLASSKKVAT